MEGRRSKTGVCGELGAAESILQMRVVESFLGGATDLSDPHKVYGRWRIEDGQRKGCVVIRAVFNHFCPELDDFMVKNLFSISILDKDMKCNRGP